MAQVLCADFYLKYISYIFLSFRPWNDPVNSYWLGNKALFSKWEAVMAKSAGGVIVSTL